jgi:Rod binding domain-containing protein
MNVSPLERRVQAENLPLENLAGNKQLSEPEKIGELSRQFEALVTRQILHDALKPVIVSKYTSSSTANGIYQDMTTSQLADRVSRGGGFGLADSLTSQLTRQLSVKEPAASQSSPQLQQKTENPR